MYRWLQNRPGVALATGLISGLLVGFGMLVGALVATDYLSSPRVQWPETSLQAVATHGTDSFAMATGPISDGVEGVFFLDFLTGELTCSVINPRTGQLGGLYRHRVIQDLGVEQGKKPSYLMVTGRANFRSSVGNVRPADSVVYVADANTGRFAAYALPWNRSAAAYNFAQTNPMVLIGKGTARSYELRE